jgi:hypothetical protein
MPAKNRQPIDSWLTSYLARKRLEALLTGIGLAFAAAVVLFITFWIIYLVVVLATFSLFPLSHETRLIVSATALGLLFIGNATADRRQLESYSFTTGTSHSKPVTLHVPFLGAGSTINPLAPDSIHSQIKVLASIVCFGPRLAAAALRSVVRLWRLSRIEIEGCAAVMSTLSAADGPVPFPELAQVLPGGHDPSIILAQVQEVPGVRLVTSEPAGLSLYSDLRKEMQKLGRRPGDGKRKKGQATAQPKDESKPRGAHG